MKIFIFILTLFFIKISTAGSFSELRGMEDSVGNTHLYYRIYQVVPGVYSDGYNNSIYHLDISNSIDTLFLEDYVHPEYFPYYSGGGHEVLDDEFWNNDPSQFIYCGFSWGWDIGSGYIGRYDSDTCFWNWGQPMVGVEISRQNDSLLYASNMIILFNSTDGGITWQELNFFNWGFQILNVSPFNDNIIFAIKDSHINKSIDGGLTFNTMDSSIFYGNELNFDSDSIHIYGISGYDFFRSSDSGNSWEIVFTDSASLHISIDPFISGQIYLSKHNQILLSHDFGDTFQLFTELNDRIVGIYKKPLINKIYVATPFDIYEIDSTGIHSIKHLTAIENNNNISTIPIVYKLEQNFPNPFNSSTTIGYKVNESANIKIVLCDITGRELELLLNEYRTPGDYYLRYDVKDRSSGIYFYQLIVNDHPVATRKMVLIK